MTDKPNVVVELKRATALFQARALATAMGVDPALVRRAHDGSIVLSVGTIKRNDDSA